MVKKTTQIGISFIIITTFLLILTSNTLAQDFVAEAKSINDRISPDEAAKFEIKITNLQDEEVRYALGLALGDLLNWDIHPSNVRVPAQTTKTFTLDLYPKSTTPIGIYQVNLNINSLQSEQQIPLSVHLSYDGLFYNFIPNVETKITLPQELDPRTNARATVTISNRNPLNIDNAEIRIRSELFTGEQKINITPGPHRGLQDMITKEFIFELDPLQKPGEYDVIVEIYSQQSGKISEDKTTVTIQGYSTTPTNLDTQRKNIFTIQNTITVENFGNREATAEVKLAANWLKKIFSKTTPEANFEKINGDSYFLWSIDLDSTEKQIITVKTNYWPLIVIMAIILLVIALYFKLRSPLIIEKEAAVIDEDKGEGSSDIRIRLFVKNRTGHPVKNIIITDRVKGITDYVESTQLGHVKPTRTTKTTKKGTMLYWDIEELEAYEERIFTYKLKSKLKVVGELTLPKSNAKFETTTGKQRKTISKEPFFRKIKKKKEKNKF
ncbi:MAG: hypothetical protein ACLFN8_04780 [Candidatus Woesearchaeota archaeon]